MSLPSDAIRNPRNLGQLIRKARQDKQLTLSELGLRSHLDSRILQEIEDATQQPSLGTLWKIAEGLEVPFGELLGTHQPSASLLRRQDSPVISSADGVLESRPLVASGSNLWVEAFELTLAPRGTYQADPHPRGTRETLVVLEGALQVHLEHENYELGPGDSLSFLADRTHTYLNPDEAPARIHNIIVYER